MKKGKRLLIGAGYSVDHAEIIGIFDLDKTTDGKITREFLARAEKNGQVVSAGEELPKSFLLSSDGKSTAVSLSQFMSSTLVKRLKGQI